MTNNLKGALLAFLAAVLAPLVGTETISPEMSGWLLGAVATFYVLAVEIVKRSPWHYTKSPKRIPDSDRGPPANRNPLSR